MKFAVLGGGCGGHAMAADLSLAGFKVNLAELPQFEENIKAIRKQGGIKISGSARNGFVMPEMVTTDMEKSLEDVDVVMFTVPAYGHKSFFNACIPYLRDGQTLIFNTGYFASLRFGKALRDIGKKNILIAETPSLIYLCRLEAPAQVFVDGLKESLQIAAFPAKDTIKVIEILKDAYPQLIPAANVLETSLSNQNPVFHTPFYIVNSGFLERNKEFSISVKNGVTSSVGRIMDSVDSEREAIGKALGIDILSIGKSITKYYGIKGRTTFELIQKCEQYATYVWKFNNGYNPYMKEDWAYALVPMASLGDQLGVPTPTIKALIRIASLMHDNDYWAEGITCEKMGLTGLKSKEIIELVTEGKPT